MGEPVERDKQPFPQDACGKNCIGRAQPFNRQVQGVLVIMMVIGDYLSGIQWVPAFLKHAPDVGFTIVVPVSNHRVSLSFVLLTLAISAAALLISELISQNYPDKRGFLCWWGENALALYILHLLILAVVVLPPIDWWYVNVPAWLAVMQISFILIFMTFFAAWLWRRRRNSETRTAK